MILGPSAGASRTGRSRRRRGLVLDRCGHMDASLATIRHPAADRPDPVLGRTRRDRRDDRRRRSGTRLTAEHGARLRRAPWLVGVRGVAGVTRMDRQDERQPVDDEAARVPAMRLPLAQGRPRQRRDRELGGGWRPAWEPGTATIGSRPRSWLSNGLDFEVILDLTASRTGRANFGGRDDGGDRHDTELSPWEAGHRACRCRPARASGSRPMAAHGRRPA